MDGWMYLAMQCYLADFSPITVWPLYRAIWLMNPCISAPFCKVLLTNQN